MATKKIAKNIKFEDALSELEAQVQLLESGELPLDKALEVFKYGVELSLQQQTGNSEAGG